MMSLREIYPRFLPVVLSYFLLFLITSAQAQQKLLDKEVSLSRTTGEIDQLLNELSRKGKFSFTYTSQVKVHRMGSVLNRKQMIRNHLSDIFRYDSLQFVEQKNKILLIPLRRKVTPAITFQLLKGLVIDSRTRKPLSYSNVFLLNKSTGTITNASGRFELKIAQGESNDTIGISYIGYKFFKMPLTALDTGTLIIRLSTERVQIREIIVKPLDPIYILTKAIEQIPANYDRKPALFSAFFRESTTQDNKNISLSEAVISIFKEPYTSLREDQIKIFKGRKGSNTDEKEIVDFIVQGGLYNTLQLDIVKNLPTFLDADYFTLYEYKIEKIITHFDRPTYVIAFDQQEGVKYPCYSGRVYIDVESLALVGASFELSEKGLNYATGIYVKKTPKKLGVKLISAKYEVYYRSYHGKWNLSNVRSDIMMRVKRKRGKQQDKFKSDFESTSEFVITHKDTADISRFRFNEISRPKDVLSEQIGETDEEFWGNENVITPDEPIEKTILRLIRRNNMFSEQEIAAIKIEEEKEAEKSAEEESTDDSSHEEENSQN
jgi:hypothetical protein